VHLVSAFQESGECNLDIKKWLAIDTSVEQYLGSIYKSREIDILTTVWSLKNCTLGVKAEDFNN